MSTSTWNCFVERSNLGVLAEFGPIVRTGILSKGSETVALHPNLVVDTRNILLDKPRYGAFYGTDLELILRARGIHLSSPVSRQISCCETTAREVAYDNATFGIVKLSAGELQKATAHAKVFVQVLTVDEMISKIERKAKPAAHA